MNFYSFFTNQFMVILPEIFLLLSILILVLYGVVYSSIYSSNIKKHYPFINTFGWLSIQTLILTIILMLNNKCTFKLLFNKTLIQTEFIVFFKVLILFFGIICIFLSFNYLKEQKINTFEYYILILLSILGSLFLISSNDLLSLYLSIEILSLSLYILAAYKRTSSLSTEAGLKYIVLGSFSSGLYLFGSSLIYGFTGTINFTDLKILLYDNTFLYNGIVIGILFLFISLLFKLGAAPFHLWVADIYEGIPLIITLFLSTVPKIAIFGILIRLCFSTFFNLIDYWQPLLSFCALSSICIGTLILITQKKIKRFLAYSSIVHMGFLLLGLSFATAQGLQASLIYLIIYMVHTINMWALVISIVCLNNGNSTQQIKYISDLNYFYKNNPILAFTFVISLFSMAGIPPLGGFFAKFSIFFAAVENKSYFLMFFSIFMSVISAFYYIRIIKIIFFENKNNFYYYKQIDYKNALILSLSILFIIFFIFFYNDLNIFIKLIINNFF